jgi:transposase
MLLPEYEALNQRIDQQAGVHEDKTGWPVQIEEKGKHGWVKTGTETPEAIFRFGQSRGGGVARDITGEFKGVGITDDYAAYHDIFKDKHQLCWSKPHRKLRDMARSDVFDKRTHVHCRETYAHFSKIYGKLRETLTLPWNSERNKRVRIQLIGQIREFAQPHKADPIAMTRVKSRLLKVTAKYFTCLLYKGIPADNNKAERALRHMVIKRRTAFGSKTQKGAEVLSVLASVILSLYWTSPGSFWEKYMAMRG